MSTPLRLGIDVSAVPLSPVGAGQYTTALVAVLARRDDVALTVVARRDDGARWQSLTDERATVLAAAPVSRPARLVFGELGLPAALRRAGPTDVLHEPHYTMPARPGEPVVVTVHDLTFVEHPEWHERSKVIVFRRALRQAARRAAVTICPSALAAERFCEHFHPRGPVVAIAHGVDRTRFRPDEPVSGADAAVLERYCLQRPFVLHVGTIEPRKNLPTLVAAFERVAEGRPEIELVLAGGEAWGRAGLDAALAGVCHGDRVRRLGYVANDDVAALLRRAVAVAYPSLEEGFGLPALEALACGAPLVTSTGTVMAEVAGDGALQVAAGDIAALAGALEELLDGGAALAERRRLGLERAATYTWEASAAAHLEVFRRAATR